MLTEIIINSNGSMFFYNEHGKSHRLDGPALEYASGGKAWFINGKRHRIDGPAWEYASGYKEWWIEGSEYHEEEFNKIVSSYAS